MKRTLLGKSIGLAIAMGLTASVATASVNDADIVNDAVTTEDIVSYGLGPQGQRFSPLKSVNTKNVKNLVPIWSFSFGGEKQRGQESQPLVKDGVMYVTGSYSRIFAVDVKTGEELWQYDARLPDGIMPCCDVINRGAALYGDLVIFVRIRIAAHAFHQIIRK